MKRRLHSIMSFIMTALIIVFNCKMISLAEGSGSANIYRSGDDVVITYDGPWEYNVAQIYSVSGSTMQNMSSIVVNQGLADKQESGSIQPKDAWYGDIAGASGSYSCSEQYDDNGDMKYRNIHYELVVPVAAFGEAESISLGYNGQSFDIELGGSDDSDEPDEVPEVTPEATPEVTPEITPEATPEITPEVTPEITPETTPTVSPSVTNAVTPVVTPGNSGTGSNINVSSDITIDGYYGDWGDYDEFEMTYNNTNGTGGHVAQIYCDGEYVYLHFKTANSYHAHMPVDQMHLLVNGDTDIALELWNAPDVWQRPSFEKGIYDMSVRMNYNYWASDGGASVTVYDLNNGNNHNGDEMEIAISLADIEKVTGIKAESMQKFTIKHVNLGGECATTAGTPTGPVMGVVFMAGAAGAGLVTMHKKRDE